MKQILVYSKEICPYCVRAKSLLQRKGAAFTEIKITDEETKKKLGEFLVAFAEWVRKNKY